MYLNYINFIASEGELQPLLIQLCILHTTILNFAFYMYIVPLHIWNYIINGWNPPIRQHHQLGLTQHMHKDIPLLIIDFLKNLILKKIYLILFLTNRARSRQSGTHNSMPCPVDSLGKSIHLAKCDIMIHYYWSTMFLFLIVYLCDSPSNALFPANRKLDRGAQLMVQVHQQMQ